MILITLYYIKIQVIDRNKERSLGLINSDCSTESPVNCTEGWRLWCDGTHGCGKEEYKKVSLQIHCCKPGHNVKLLLNTL